MTSTQQIADAGLARMYKHAMDGVRNGSLAPEGFRIIIRELREDYGDKAVDAAKAAAIGASNR